MKFDVSVTLLFNSEEAAKAFRFGTSRISMGEFYPAPDFLGKHSLLVKNVLYNKSMTNVGIHFAKGRLMVSTYLTNYKQTAAQNERDLIEFVRAIEPLLNAKLTFEEV